MTYRRDVDTAPVSRTLKSLFTRSAPSIQSFAPSLLSSSNANVLERSTRIWPVMRAAKRLPYAAPSKRSKPSGTAAASAATSGHAEDVLLWSMASSRTTRSGRRPSRSGTEYRGL